MPSKPTFDYFKADEVISPKDFIKKVHGVYDGTPNGKDFSIALLDWKGERVYGIRWNRTMREANDPKKKSGQKKCIGIPVSFARPVWFVLPTEFNDFIEKFIANNYTTFN